MNQNWDSNGAYKRVIDYSDPARLPHDENRAKRRRKDTGRYVTAGVVTGMLIIGGFAYAGYVTENFGFHPRLTASPDGGGPLTTSSIKN